MFGGKLNMMKKIFVLTICITVAFGMTTSLFEDDEVEKIVAQLLDDINRAYLTQDEELLKQYYDLESLYGKWAYEYALNKLNHIDRWSNKQGIDFINLKSDYTITNITGSDDAYNLTAKSIDQYTYQYSGDNEQNTYQMAVYHYMRIEMKGDRWVITKDWFSDPMSETADFEGDKLSGITEFIVNYEFPGYKLTGRRKGTVKYADKYSSATLKSSYNQDYRNYNPVGGDCANFISQVLHEGGKLSKNSIWNYHKGGSLAWIKAYNLTNYMLNSGRGSRIAVGLYDDVYQSAYKLQPGDIIAYEEKGDIKHVSVVTGYDSKGYPLVNCHNVDRYRVPWDIGWNRAGIKFWLIRVHY